MTKDELREASVDRLIEELDYCGFLWSYREYREEIIEVIKERLERPKGKWIFDDCEAGKVWTTCRCSICNKDPFRFVVGVENLWIYKKKLPRFCPNCGAEMEAEE